MIRFYRENETGDYLAADTGTNGYYRQVFGQDHFEGRATAIGGLIGSVCTTGIARAYLKQNCKRVARAVVPAEWRRAIGAIEEKTTVNIFDHLHRANFDKLFSLDEEGRQAKERLLRDAGFTEEMIAQFCSPGVKAGMTLGGAKAIDVMTLVERVLFRQNAGSVLLRVSRPPFDEAGQVEIAVLEVGPPAEEAESGDGTNPEGQSQ